MDISIIILAAGRGTRMHSNNAKVLQSLAGKPLICHVLDTAATLANQTIVIYGFDGDNVKNRLQGYDVLFAEQKDQLGTGHAVKMALPHLPKTGKSLILYGDVPLISKDTLTNLAQSPALLTILTATVQNPFGLGRIVRQNGKVVAIVEQRDANDDEQSISEINSGIYAVDNALLHRYLPNLENNNAQGEYYLTDIVKMAVAEDVAIDTISPALDFEITGVNDRIQLATLERAYQAYLVGGLQKQGVQFADPNRVDIRGTLTCGADVFIDVNTIFVGDVVLGDGVVIDNGNTIKNCTIGAGSHILPNCVLDSSIVGKNVNIGPFAHVRPKSDIGDNAKLGNFVETKKATIGTGSKVNHLSYIGDCQMGQNVNIGAGVITCNYDGANKHATTIQDHAFVGSNTSLVAPVSVGKNATIGAGSVITKNVGDDVLAIGRGRQVVVEGWTRPVKTKN